MRRSARPRDGKTKARGGRVRAGSEEASGASDPRFARAEAYFRAAAGHQSAGRLEEALTDYAKALALNPSDARAYNNMGVALRALGRPEAALASYRRSPALRQDDPGLFSNMGNILRHLGRQAEAAECLRRSVALRPDSADSWRNLGLVLRDLGELEEAIACFDRADALRPNHTDTIWDRAYAYLLKGDLAAGFAGYEVRWGLAEAKPRGFSQPQWRGEDLAGRTLLVYAEQGFGDTIQFARYLPRLAGKGGRVVAECQPELMELLAGIPGVERFVAKGDALPDFDLQCPLVSLPHILGTVLETVPAEIPYLSVAPSDGQRIETAPGISARIGLAWGGSPTHKNDRNRSIPFEHFLRLAERPDTMLYSLQKGGRTEVLQSMACAALIRNLAPRIESFADTARFVEQLDLVVTCDTSVAHLAGALGKPVWVLLPFAPDWRWLRERTDSPWYPTMRLFRQTAPGDWAEVFDAVRAALDGFVSNLPQAKP
jgi:Tfp pilus assembly protein PilF